MGKGRSETLRWLRAISVKKQPQIPGNTPIKEPNVCLAAGLGWNFGVQPPRPREQTAHSAYCRENYPYSLSCGTPAKKLRPLPCPSERQRRILFCGSPQTCHSERQRRIFARISRFELLCSLRRTERAACSAEHDPRIRVLFHVILSVSEESLRRYADSSRFAPSA